MKRISLFLLIIFPAVCAMAQNAPKLKPLPQNGFVTLKELVSDFQTAPDAAQKKYVGRELIVYGRVGKLSSPNDNGDGVLVVYLQERETSNPDVKADFAMDDLPPNSSMEVSSNHTQAMIMRRARHSQEVRATRPYISVDENIGICGSCTGVEMGDVVLKNCHKVFPRRIKALLKKNDKNSGL